MDLVCTDTTPPSSYISCLNLEIIGQAATYYSVHLFVSNPFQILTFQSIYFVSFKIYLQIYFNSCDPNVFSQPSLLSNT